MGKFILIITCIWLVHQTQATQVTLDFSSGTYVSSSFYGQDNFTVEALNGSFYYAALVNPGTLRWYYTTTTIRIQHHLGKFSLKRLERVEPLWYGMTFTSSKGGSFWTAGASMEPLVFSGPEWEDVEYIEMRSGRDILVVLDNIVLDVADSDADGIPDAWEIQYFGSLNQSMWVDSDGDGQTNRFEYLAGTDPTNRTSRFELDRVVKTPDEVVVYWIPYTNRVYSVLWTSNLTTAFETIGANIEFPMNSYTDSVHGATSCGFYKIKVHLHE